MDAIATDPILKLRNPGIQVGNLALSLDKQIKTDTEFQQTLSEFISGILYPLLLKRLDSLSKRELVDNMFYKSSVSATNQLKWKSLLASVEIDEQSTLIQNNLFQTLIDKCWLFSLQWRTKLYKEPPKELTEEELKLTQSEEETLRYVAGYIPYSLRKKYRNMKSEAISKAVVTFLNSWSTTLSDDDPSEVMSFLTYTRRWVDQCNRGGLFVVNDNVYIFIRRIENVARKLFNRDLLLSYCNEDIREVLLDDFSNSSLIDLSWTALTRKIENKDLCMKLKTEVLNKWINIRAKSFLNAWLAIQKLRLEKVKTGKKDALSNKAEPSLRKSLPLQASSSGLSDKSAPSMRHSLHRKSTP